MNNEEFEKTETVVATLRQDIKGEEHVHKSDKDTLIKQAEEAFESAKGKGWVGLKDEERSKIWGELPQTSNEERDACIFAQAIEAKLKEKNSE